MAAKKSDSKLSEREIARRRGQAIAHADNVAPKPLKKLGGKDAKFAPKKGQSFRHQGR